MSNKSYNTRRENLGLNGNKYQRRRKYKNIINELGARNITLHDLSKGLDETEKLPGFLDMLNTTEMTMDDLVILQQYSNAILKGDTKSATFLRDTAEGSPRQSIEIEDNQSALSKLSLDELLAIKEDLHKLAESGAHDDV